MYQRCTRCVMDNASDRTIHFDKDGHCNYCNDIIRRMPSEYYPDGEKKLLEIVEGIKEECKNDEFDCMVGVSGGIDSSYIMYLGYKYGLRMLAVHIDDGLDHEAAIENIRKLTEKTGAKSIKIEPKRDEYADILYSLFRASVSNLAIAQDNLIIKSLQEYGEKNNIRYILDGSNFAHESILERDRTGVNSSDRKYILSVHKRFGRIPVSALQFMSLTDRYIRRHMKGTFKHLRPLNYIDYRLDEAIDRLKDFCGFEYYGGKHYESILTRFMQCYYLPEKFGIDKRKSHYSSLIMSGQMSREEALERLEKPLYQSAEMLMRDKKFLAEYMDISLDELENMIAMPPKGEREYPHSWLNEAAPLARKFRKVLE